MTRLIARRAVLSATALLPLVSIIRPARAAAAIRLGTMAGDSETVFQAAADEAKSRGLDVKIIGFNDYVLPNAALDHNELDANAFQHQPYLDDQIKSRGYHLVPVGFTYIAPIGIYSRKIHAVADLPQGAHVGVPNDPTNGGRGLLLLQTLGLIKLRPGAGLAATSREIAENPKGLKIIELDAGILARSLDDLTIAVINTNWAATAGFDVAHERIAVEPLENNPYRNIVAVKQGRENEPWVKTLVESIHTDHFRQVLQTTWKGTVVPAF